MTALLRASRLAIRAFLVCAPLMLLIIFLTGGGVRGIVAFLASGSIEKIVVMLVILAVPSTIAAVLAFLFALIPTRHGQPRSGAEVGACAGGLTPLCLFGLVFLFDWIRGGPPGLFYNPFPSILMLCTPPLMVIGVVLGVIFGAWHDSSRNGG